jgi:hypothetical protein
MAGLLSPNGRRGRGESLALASLQAIEIASSRRFPQRHSRRRLRGIIARRPGAMSPGARFPYAAGAATFAGAPWPA